MELRLQRQILIAASFAEQASLVGAPPEIALQVAADEVVGALVAALHGMEPGRFDRSGVIREPHRLVRAAIELLELSHDEPVSVTSVCRRLQISERTLQRAFKESIGISLRAFERQRRLRAVHGAILAEGDRRTITDIAMSFGFWHLSRFAGAYKAMFGCAPAETRNRVWGLQRSPELVLGEVLWPAARSSSEARQDCPCSFAGWLTSSHSGRLNGPPGGSSPA